MAGLSKKFWRRAIRAYVQKFPFPKGKRIVVESLAPLYEDDREEICELPEGARMRVDLREHVQRLVYFFGVYEWESVTWFRRQLRRGMTFLDVGSHVGQYSLIAARLVGETGRVHAFEPNPVTFKRLADNVALNGYTRVSLHAMACSDKPGEATLFMPKNDNLGEASLQQCTDEVTTAPIISTTLEEWSKTADLGNPPRVDVMKIDVQGFEGHVVAGAREMLDRFRPTILCEFEERWLNLAGTSSPELKQQFRMLGYDVQRIDGDRLVPVPNETVHYFDNLVLVPLPRSRPVSVPGVSPQAVGHVPPELGTRA